MSKKYITAEQIIYQLANLHQLTFEVTDACNLQCKYCAYGELYNDYDKRENKKLSINIAIKLIDYLSELWNSAYNTSASSHIYISFYGGEPLLNMPFIQAVVKYIQTRKERRRKFTFTMTTNGILLNRYIDYLVEHNFHLTVSLDGNATNNTYRTYKNAKPAYPDIIKNIDLLRKKYPLFFEQNVNFNSVLHNRNSIAEIYHFFKTEYNKIPSIGELNNMGIRPDKIPLFQETYRNATESLYQSEHYEKIEKDMFLKTATYQSVTNFIHQHSGFVFRDYTNLLFGPVPKSIPTGTCIPFSRKMFVTVNGKILPCERIGQQYALGFVTEENVSIDPEKIADKYNAYLTKLQKQCNNCYNFHSCIQCIYNLHDLDGEPVCYGYMNKEQFNEHKARQMDFLRRHPEEYYRIMEDVIIN